MQLLAQNTITGKVTDDKTLQPIPGAIIVVKGTATNAATDDAGIFRITIDKPLPITLVVSFAGYVAKEIAVNSYEPLQVALKDDTKQLQQASVKGRRITEKQKEAALTVVTLDRVALKEIPTSDFYEGLGALQGVDVTSASFGFKVINTRGFNSTSPVRSLQLIDGVDNQSPGLNLSLGNFLGAPEVDIQKVEIIEGASSSFYGPNAFNGVINMTTRSPFTSKGMEVIVKTGERNLYEGTIRLANYFKNKQGRPVLGFKLNVYGMKAYDWLADNRAATPQSKSGVDNPGGYDAVNVYGDEFIRGFDYTNQAGSFPGLGIAYRRGYAEKDLVNRNAWNVKTNAGIYYKITPNTQIEFTTSFCTGNTIYQGDNRYMLRDVLFFQNKLEIKHENKWFVRAYATNENSGRSYDTYFTALQLQQAAKGTGAWKTDYENYWNNNYNLSYVRTLPGFPQPPGPGQAYVDWLAQVNPFLLNNYRDSLVAWHTKAQAFANGVGYPGGNGQPFFEPGTQRFDTAFAGITSRKSYGQRGTMFYDRSALYHIQGEYKFNPAFCQVTTGGSFRLYAPNTQGTIMADTNGATIRNKEYGFYAGAEKWMVNKKLKVDLTGRLDKNQNFNFVPSAAASAVYKIGGEHFVRASFSSAVRNPTLSDQYLYYNAGQAILLGNTKGIDGLVTIPSLIKSYDYNQNFDTLSYFNVKAVKPEQVKTVEIGYRATIAKHLYVDVNAYYSWYKYFIGYKIGASVDTITIKTAFGDYSSLRLNNIYRVATNSEDMVTTSGISLGLNYYFTDYFVLSGNYSWNKLDRHGSTDPLIPSYNTPEHKFNINFSGRDIYKFSFSINYKWVQGFRFEGSPQFTGDINTYDIVDVQVNRKFPQMRSVVKLGVGNLLNNQHYEVYGGPLIGRLGYVSIQVALFGEKNK